MTHPYFDYCDSHDRRRQELQAGRHIPILAVFAGHLRHAIACIAARTLPV